jgi:hypothetical protein
LNIRGLIASWWGCCYSGENPTAEAKMTEKPDYLAMAQEVEAMAAQVVPCYQGEAREEVDLIFAQFIGLCSRSKWSKHRTKSPFLALLAMAGSNAAYKIISACSNAVS